VCRRVEILGYVWDIEGAIALRIQSKNERIDILSGRWRHDDFLVRDNLRSFFVETVVGEFLYVRMLSWILVITLLD